MRVVITGSIATGKSFVSSLFAEHGYVVIDADKIAHKILDESIYEIVEIFGKEYLKEGKINRKKLGSLIFEDKRKKEILENLLHPKIRKNIENKVNMLEKQKRKFILDIPLFFESKGYSADKVIVVYAPRELQLQRLMRRDRLTKDEALKRIVFQIDIEKKKELADIVIDNSKDIDTLINNSKKVIRMIDADFKI